MARRVFELLTEAKKKNDLESVKEQRVLDLCAGCGIVGLEFVFHLQKEFGVGPLSLDFLEIQQIYQAHLETNIQRLGQVISKLNTQFDFINKNYDCLQEDYNLEKYDIILCNPPYFFTHQGILSPSQFKNRCRFFIDSSFKNLLTGITNSLVSGGQAFLLLRDLTQHKWNSLQETEKIIMGQLKMTVIGQIRGTHLIRLSK